MLPEEPARVITKASGIGTDIGDAVTRGTIQLLWRPPFELIGDRVAEEVLDHIRRHSVKRLVLDGVEAFIRAQSYPDRAIGLLAALARELRVLGVTTLFTEEVFPSGGEIDLPRQGQTGLADNILLLRYVQHRSHLRRLISVLKKRDGRYDTSLHEFQISDAGLEVGPAFTGDEQAARRPAPSTTGKRSRPGGSGKPAKRKRR